MIEKEYIPELYPPRISESLQRGLWWLGVGLFCGWIFGVVFTVIFLRGVICQ